MTTRQEVLGWMVISGPLLLLAVWIVAGIPLVVWLVLLALPVVLAVAFRRQLSEGWSEGKRRQRVLALRQEIGRLETERHGLKTWGYFRITPEEFKRELAELEHMLEVARQDLRSIWQQSDGW